MTKEQYRIYLLSPEWKAIKAKKESTRSKRCAICLSTEQIDLHHLFYRPDFKDTETSDLRWLCRRCHTLTHELIKSGCLRFKPGASHHSLFGSTKNAVRAALGLVRLRIDNQCEMAKKLDELRTPKGGFTKKALASIGIPWPPPKGWRKKLIRESLLNPPNPSHDMIQ